MNKFAIVSIFIVFSMGFSAVSARPTRLASLYPGSYYQGPIQKESLISRREMPKVDRFFEHFDNFEHDNDEEIDEFPAVEYEEEQTGRELVNNNEEEEGTSGREHVDEDETEFVQTSASKQPEFSRFTLPRDNHFELQRSAEKNSFARYRDDEETAATDLGYFRGYAPRSIVLSDDTSFEARFPFPKFPTLEFPFDRPFGSK